ncbi:MAG: addiction module protein [Rhizonema sp. PD37]|nr:addiction module protein [Rhizonema sp. PD37]
MNVEHEALFNLSPSERLLLAQDLWDSLSIEDIPLSEGQKLELDRRKAVYETNPGCGR